MGRLIALFVYLCLSVVCFANWRCCFLLLFVFGLWRWMVALICCFVLFFVRVVWCCDVFWCYVVSVCPFGWSCCLCLVRALVSFV